MTRKRRPVKGAAPTRFLDQKDHRQNSSGGQVGGLPSGIEPYMADIERCADLALASGNLVVDRRSRVVVVPDELMRRGAAVLPRHTATMRREDGGVVHLYRDAGGPGFEALAAEYGAEVVAARLRPEPVVVSLAADIHGRALDYIADVDRSWFAAHPGEDSYRRPALEHELCDPLVAAKGRCQLLEGIPEASDVVIEVAQLEPGVRTRRIGLLKGDAA